MKKNLITVEFDSETQEYNLGGEAEEIEKLPETVLVIVLGLLEVAKGSVMSMVAKRHEKHKRHTKDS